MAYDLYARMAEEKLKAMNTIVWTQGERESWFTCRSVTLEFASETIKLYCDGCYMGNIANTCVLENKDGVKINGEIGHGYKYNYVRIEAKKIKVYYRAPSGQPLKPEQTVIVGIEIVE